jgi:hypothetical protein
MKSEEGAGFAALTDAADIVGRAMPLMTKLALPPDISTPVLPRSM